MFLRHKICRKSQPRRRPGTRSERRGARPSKRSTRAAIRPDRSRCFQEDRAAPALNCDVVHVRLGGVRLDRPRQWGACWLACHVWDQLRLDDFWSPRLPASPEGTGWLDVLKTLVAYRLINPGGERRLHRQWYERSAVGDLLGADFALAHKDNLYRFLDKLLLHKTDLFASCNNAPDGLPLACEVMAGNTSDKTTLRDFIKRIETQYGRARRTWVMDRGIPTEKVLAEMRASEPPIQYLVGPPRRRRLEQDFLAKPWAQVRDAVQVKLVEQDGDLYILARSGARRDKSLPRRRPEQAMRRRRLKKLIKRLHELRQQKLTRDRLLIKLGRPGKRPGRPPGGSSTSSCRTATARE